MIDRLISTTPQDDNKLTLPSISRKPMKMDFRVTERIQSNDVNCPPLRGSPTSSRKKNSMLNDIQKRDLDATIHRRQMLKSTNSKRLLDTFQKTKSSREVLKQDPSFQEKILEYETIQPIDEIQEAKQKIFSQLDDIRKKSRNNSPENSHNDRTGGQEVPNLKISTIIPTNSIGNETISTPKSSSLTVAPDNMTPVSKKTKKKKPRRFESMSIEELTISDTDEGKMYASDIGKESFKVICQARRTLIKQNSYLQEMDGYQSSIKEKLERNRNLLKPYSNQNPSE
ncbi:predicted protein [Naegleria gruberi]|uniref:Predicted protein n=1 Tax=Naegleria gruberi TaxID=5762 RepID=D2VTK3_NAEGR|nr:uncharacterized protein NAEGRDRAFT_72333 [Naegleria gruberi]EFC39877.1 predicted protein [Naegleria gruberi]|eukprot:XP_002672621.1 predicted protein [Naegleria gruberi strain NEG-M]